MSRHRELKNIMKEEDEDYPDDAEDYGYDQEEGDFDPEDEEYINEVWEIVGDQYDREGIIKALDETDWDKNQAVNLLLLESAKYMKKKPKNTKKETAKTQPQNSTQAANKKIPDSDPLVKKNNSQESEVSVKTTSSASEPQTFIRKNSEDVKPGFIPQFLDKAKYNDPVPTIEVPKGVIDLMNKQKKFHLVVCGHVDSGKSTLVGHLLYAIGEIDKNTMHKYEKESSQMGKGSFKYAWALDETEEERRRGITIDVGVKEVDYKDKSIVFLDAPGHKEYVPNMIAGTAQADTALLVIDSIKGAFEGAFNHGGQTREHAILVRSMGIENIIVAINKLDWVEWSSARYDYIKSQIELFLQEIGFKEENIFTLPVSALHGDNLVEQSKRSEIAWYTGPCLLQLFEKLSVGSKSVDKPFRGIVNSFYNNPTGKTKGLCISAKIEAGFIEKGTKCIVLPSCAEITVKDVFSKDEKKDFAISGELVTFVITAQEYDISNLKSGGVMCLKSHPIPMASRFLAEIEVFEFERPLIRGERAIIHIGLTRITGIIVKINHILKKNSTEILKKNPKVLNSGQIASVEILTEKPVCMELFKNYPLLGRVILREKMNTIASGIITSIIE